MKLKDVMKHSIVKRGISAIVICAMFISTMIFQIQGKNTVVAETTISKFVGNWSSASYALGKEQSTMGFDMLISEDGSIEMEDRSSGNPAIIGKITEVTDSTIQLECDSLDFAPPWSGMKPTDELEYHFYNENQMRLTYKDTSIVYYRSGSAFTFNKLFSNNWKNDKNRDWLTSDGTTGKVTYKLKTYVDALLLYRVERGKETLLNSFTCLNTTSKNSTTKTIKTITELADASKLPKNWRTMKEGRHFQNFTLQYDSAKHALKVTYNKQTYTFYSNLIYGMNKNSDAYKIYKSSWRCKTGGRNLQLSTSIDKGVQEIYFVDLNAKDDFYSGSATAVFNERKKSISLNWIKDECTSSFYKDFKSHKTMTYSFKSSTKLVIKLGNKSYTFTKVK